MALSAESDLHAEGRESLETLHFRPPPSRPQSSAKVADEHNRHCNGGPVGSVGPGRNTARSLRSLSPVRSLRDSYSIGGWSNGGDTWPFPPHFTLLYPPHAATQLPPFVMSQDVYGRSGGML
jgi:hypothetical protein